MAAPERQPDRRRWIIWTLSSAGGWFLACFGGVTLAAVIWPTLFTQAGLALFTQARGVSEFAYIGLTAIICGAIGGWCQWLLLRHYLQLIIRVFRVASSQPAR